ncbi:hypothetical protein SAMD00023353_0201790 [Rosellinia necatrix]|uniref:Uncharacterized protein n=1 Tax=Rosellinia necatrix TaxID=77044 RepID=A0A1S8A510_ROSNE|nr:hypothetical protein SAMD00023353_0201790 [Rosellinia necatrix]
MTTSALGGIRDLAPFLGPIPDVGASAPRQRETSPPEVEMPAVAGWPHRTTCGSTARRRTTSGVAPKPRTIYYRAAGVVRDLIGQQSPSAGCRRPRPLRRAV